MNSSRRLSLILAAASLAAACGPRSLVTPAKAGPMDTKRLDLGFPALAQRARPGAFAMGVMNLETTDTWYWNTDRAFPLAGAAALPIVAAALSKVDAGRLSLAEPVAFAELDLSPPPSPIDRGWKPGQRTGALPVSSLCVAALHQDDTTASDVLMKRLGGPGAVTAFLDLLKVTGLRVDRYHRETGVQMFAMPTFRPEWKDAATFDAARDQVTPLARQAAMDAFILDPRDSSTAPAALGFLALLADGQLVSGPSTRQLLAWMGKAPSWFRAGLPDGVGLAASSGQTPTDLGFTPGMAELAIATFPGPRRYALCGFLAGSTATDAARAALFADGARLAAAAIG